MDFDLQEQHIAVQKLVRDFAQKEIAPVIARYDEAEEFPTDIIRKLGELGVMGLPFPEKYGGGGADTISYIIALEELARVDSSVGITVEADVTLGGMPLLLYGAEEQKRRWLTPLAQGKALGAFGLTEPSGGSDNRGMQTTATVQNGHWVINGTKCFITNAGTEMTTFATVAAVTGARPQGGKEFSSILVPTGTPGYSI
ncbi:MAG: acyl-CoA dehydrogenase family protein, partial [Chloroflexota bacterium]